MMTSPGGCRIPRHLDRQLRPAVPERADGSQSAADNGPLCVTSVGGFLEDASRLCAVEDYLAHEAKKLVNRKLTFEAAVHNPVLRPSIRRLLNMFFAETCDHPTAAREVVRGLSVPDRWQLFAAVSSGVCRKSLFSVVANPATEWRLTRVDLRRLVLRSPQTPLSDTRRLSFDDCVRGLRKCPEADRRKGLGTYERGSLVHRSADPLIGTVRRRGIQIWDGNGRLMCHAIRQAEGAEIPETLPVWVGFPRAATDREAGIFLNRLETLSPLERWTRRRRINFRIRIAFQRLAIDLLPGSTPADSIAALH